MTLLMCKFISSVEFALRQHQMQKYIDIFTQEEHLPKVYFMPCERKAKLHPVQISKFGIKGIVPCLFLHVSYVLDN